jgi:hypothetical protein
VEPVGLDPHAGRGALARGRRSFAAPRLASGPAKVQRPCLQDVPHDASASEKRSRSFPPTLGDDPLSVGVSGEVGAVDRDVLAELGLLGLQLGDDGGDAGVNRGSTTDGLAQVACCSATRRTVRVHVGRTYSDFTRIMPTIVRMGLARTASPAGRFKVVHEASDLGLGE